MAISPAQITDIKCPTEMALGWLLKDDIREEHHEAVLQALLSRDISSLQDRLSEDEYEDLQAFVTESLNAESYANNATIKGHGEQDNPPTVAEINGIFNSVIQKALDEKQQVEVANHDQALFDAVGHGNLGEVERLLSQATNPNQKFPPYGATALSTAVVAGNLEMVNVLLADARVDVTQLDNNMNSPLAWALLQRNRDIAMRLIEAGSPLHIQDTKYRHTPLMLAILKMSPRTDTMDAVLQQIEAGLLEDNAKLAAASSAPKVEADSVDAKLHFAINKGNRKDALSLLDDENLKLDAVDADGNTALHLALLEKNRELARELVERGAQVNVPNSQGLTPLMLLARNLYQTEPGKDERKSWLRLGHKMVGRWTLLADQKPIKFMGETTHTSTASSTADDKPSTVSVKMSRSVLDPTKLLVSPIINIADNKPRAPKEVVLVLDVSGSMGNPVSRPRLALLKQAVKEQIMPKLQNGDSLSIVTFASDVKVECDKVKVGSDDWNLLPAKIDKFKTRGTTNLGIGLIEANKLLVDRDNASVLFLTDGDLSRGTITKPNKLLGLLEDEQGKRPKIIPVGLSCDQGKSFIEQMAKANDGQFLMVADPKKLVEAFAPIDNIFETTQTEPATLTVTVRFDVAGEPQQQRLPVGVLACNQDNECQPMSFVVPKDATNVEVVVQTTLGDVTLPEAKFELPELDAAYNAAVVADEIEKAQSDIMDGWLPGEGKAQALKKLYIRIKHITGEPRLDKLKQDLQVSIKMVTGRASQGEEYTALGGRSYTGRHVRTAAGRVMYERRFDDDSSSSSSSSSMVTPAGGHSAVHSNRGGRTVVRSSGAGAGRQASAGNYSGGSSSTSIPSPMASGVNNGVVHDDHRGGRGASSSSSASTFASPDVTNNPFVQMHLAYMKNETFGGMSRKGKATALAGLLHQVKHNNGSLKGLKINNEDEVGKAFAKWHRAAVALTDYERLAQKEGYYNWRRTYQPEAKDQKLHAELTGVIDDYRPPRDPKVLAKEQHFSRFR